MKLNKLPVFAVSATLWFAACSDENNAVANLEGYATSPEELISGNEIPTNDIPDTQNPGTEYPGYQNSGTQVPGN